LSGIKNVQGIQNAKVGDIILEIQNLQKREEVTLDAVSAHDFTEVRSILHIEDFCNSNMPILSFVYQSVKKNIDSSSIFFSYKWGAC
jgi:glycerol-3-phosphate dehydrogenase